MINQFTKNMKPTLSSDKKKVGKGRSRIFGMLFLFSVFALMMASLVWLRLHYQGRTEELNNEAAQLDIQIEKDRFMVKNLKNRKEELCSWSHVGRKIAEYKLPLRPRKTSQVTYLKRFKAPDQSKSVQTASSANTDSTVASADTYEYHSEY